MTKEYYQKNKEKIKEKKKKYYLANAELLKAKANKQYYVNRIKNLEYHKKYHVENREVILVKKQEYYATNRIKILAQRRTYAKLKKEEIKNYKKEYINKRRKTEPQFRLDDNISNAICKALNGKKAGRKWQTIVGYSLEELKEHLESQFTDGMSWENYGKWHVDHIKPKCSFIYSNEKDQQFMECWALTNLRPLWSIDNLRKSSSDKKQSNNSKANLYEYN